MLAGADFIKTSTGKVAVNATPPNTLLMLEAVRDFRAADRRPGRREAGRRHPYHQGRDQVPGAGQRDRSARTGWTTDWFRFGASSLLNDLLMQRQKLSTGRYSGPDYVTVD